MDIFERVEKKYMLTKEQYENLINILESKLTKDKFYNYKICNIYYDTDNYDLFRLSNEKPIYKEKLRLRSYGVPNLETKVFLEIKKKYKGIVYKRRIDEKLSNIYNFLEDKNIIINNCINEKEIRFFTKKYDIKPKVYLSYDRYAYSWYNNKDFRITFDYNIKYRLNNVSLENGDDGLFLLDDKYILMELKTINSFPIEFVRLLSELQIYPISFSKIGTVYKNIILKGDKNNDNN